MSRAFGFAGAGLAGICGMLVMYTTLRPELERQKQERLGHEFTGQHADDQVISKAILSDIREARSEAKNRVVSSGFAWGIREAIWGKNDSQKQDGAKQAGKDTEAKGNR